MTPRPFPIPPAVPLALLALALGFLAPAPTTRAQSPPAVQGDVERGGQLFRSICVECHGETAGGLLEKQSPSLHQQEGWYLRTQLRNFRAGLRGTAEGDSLGAEMREKALSLPDDEAVNDVVAYIKTIDGPEPMPPTLTGDVEAGKRHYDLICMACHGTDGRGQFMLKSPSLVGQSDWYMVNQIRKFRDGRRGYDSRDLNGLQMKTMMATLPNDQAILDVVTYVRTLE